jgi:hypothetical protein
LEGANFTSLKYSVIDGEVSVRYENRTFREKSAEISTFMTYVTTFFGLMC